jgi:transcription elongation factor GreA-like protein
MRLLFISGDDDYHFLTFEDQDKFSIEQIITKCEKSKNRKARFKIKDEYFDAELHEFGTVDEKFIEFVKSIQDYDDEKHRGWIVINQKQTTC